MKIVFGQANSVHYANYQNLCAALDRLWIFLEQFIAQNEMTTESLRAQRFPRGEMKLAVNRIKTPNNSPPELYDRIRTLRAKARIVAAEGDHIWDVIQEAIIKLEENQQDRSNPEQLPALPQHYDKYSETVYLSPPLNRTSSRPEADSANASMARKSESRHSLTLQMPDGYPMHATHQRLGENLQRPSFTPAESSDRYIPREGNIEASSEHGTDRETTGNKDDFDLQTKEEPSHPYKQQKAAFSCEGQGFLGLQQHLKSFSQDEPGTGTGWTLRSRGKSLKYVLIFE